MSIGLLAFGVLGTTACSRSGFVAAKVKLNAETITLAIGDTYQLKASRTKGYEDAELMWFTSNETIAYVDSGYVMGVGEGEATVTVVCAGGSASCKVTVSGQGSGTVTERLSVSPTTRSLAVGGTFTLAANAYPSETTVEFTSSNEAVATVAKTSERAATVTALAVGSAIITATGSNGKMAACSVTVSEAGGGGEVPSTERDIAVRNNLNYSGYSIRVGAPKNQVVWMNGILADFNALTGSSVEFTVSEFEEDAGTSAILSPEGAPDIFPYASDQTMNFDQLKVLASVPNSDKTWIRSNMGSAVLEAATYRDVLGYPFTSDNGSVMFYNKKYVSDPSEIDTVDKLFKKAADLDLEVNIAYGNGFYCGGILNTYNNGVNLCTITPKTTSYSQVGNFNSENGLKGIKLLHRIIKDPNVRNGSSAPIDANYCLATIVDVSNVADFKNKMKENYATAPAPFTDENKDTRLGTFLGYKFYGVNNTLDTDVKQVAFSVAKFLCSEYVQAKRFDEFKSKATLLSLQEYCSEESHIASLTEQAKNNGTILLTPMSMEFWSETAVLATNVKNLGDNPTDEEFKTILAELDDALYR